MQHGGFLREMAATSNASSSSNLATQSSSASSSSPSSSSLAQRLNARNAQAVKVMLSEQFIRWASDVHHFEAIETLTKEMLAAAGKPQPQQQAPQLQQRYNDPLQPSTPSSQSGDSGAERDRTSPSPPPSPPMRQRTNRKDGGGGAIANDRTPSPVQHHTRYLSVDELDAHAHRAPSPGAASPVSPTAMFAPKGAGEAAAGHRDAAPLPHAVQLQSSASLSSSTGTDSLGAVVGGYYGTSDRTSSPVDSVLPNNEGKKYVTQHTGPTSFAQQPTQRVPVATLHDVPLFFNKLEPEGHASELRLEELDTLANLFAKAGSGTNSDNKGSSSWFGGKSASNNNNNNKVVVDIDTNKTVRKAQFARICKDVFAIPIWFKDALYRRIAAFNALTDTAPLNYHHIKKYFDSAFGRLTPNRRLFELIRQSPRAKHLTLEDLQAAIKYLVDSHPGLEFLKQPEFQLCYCRTVAIRIVFELDKQQSRTVSWSTFDRCDLPIVMRELDDAVDINQVLRYFSYEHFYVLYCRFWELDSDHDELIGQQELLTYGQHALTPQLIQRVVQGAGRKLSSGTVGKLNYEDFVYFCLSEEDKNHPAAVLYWFKVLDLDADGVLSGYELGKFFEENRARFAEATGGEELKYEDMLCQMLDMVGANKIKEHPLGLTLSDFRSCEAPANFFNMVFNCTKFLNFEHRDPFTEHQQKSQPEKTDWDRFARIEYDRMANEVGQ